ncbi:MAG: GNAT family N-acetyltransferase [Rhodobacter sp.]|nr:GNAT family N-acetyltransferase [Rhodobacter sp.]
MTIPVIETERLTLRRPRIEDFDAYAAVFASDRSRFMDGPKPRREAWDEFASDCAAWVLRGYGIWSVETKDYGALAGWAGIIHPERYHEPELGWFLVEEYEGQGYAFEAAKAARQYARQNFGLNCPVSFISTGNHRSIRLAERLGATVEETRGSPDDRFFVYRHPASEAAQ